MRLPLYALFAAAAVIRRRNETDTSTKLETVYLVMAILYFCVAASEVFGIGAAYKQSIRLVRYYFYAQCTSAVVVTAAEVLRIVVHFTDKSAILDACQAGEKQDQQGSNDPLSDNDIADYCNWVWRRSTYWDFGLLILSLLFAFLFASLAGAYLHQLMNPSLLRTRVPFVGQATGAPSSQYNSTYPLDNVAVYPPNPYSLDPPVGGFGYAAPPYAQGGLPEYSNNDDYRLPPEKNNNNASSSVVGFDQARDPFSDQGGLTSQEYEQRQHDEEMRRRAQESTETVTLEPRHEREGRI
ncbi:hypothetical protein OIO90_000440 [Microbotryomycetes sp. JL221]|nr:hypothetical protein OIO90_000440 [Microbotryomycetes sp. JL221]